MIGGLLYTLGGPEASADNLFRLAYNPLGKKLQFFIIYGFSGILVRILRVPETASTFLRFPGFSSKPVKVGPTCRDSRPPLTF